MTPAKAVSLVFLFILWAVLPWPLARWAAAFAGLFLALGALWSFLLCRSLSVGAHAPVLRTFSGRRLEVATWVENRSPLPSGLLFVSDSAGNLECWGPTRRFVTARPFTRLRFAFSVRARERGERILGPLLVAGSDPTGLFPFVRHTAQRTLVVYPALHGVQGRPSRGLPTGPRGSRSVLVDDVSRFRTYRDFQAGDSLSRVSAAAWARSGFPQVRTYDRTAARPTVVVVDLRAAGYPLRLRWALIEAAVETAASLVWALLGQGETLWLNVIDRGGEGRPAALGPCRGWGEARLFLERLALAMPDKAEELVPCFLPIFPSSAARILWVGPAGRDPPPMTYEVVRFPIEEDGVHDLISPS